MRRRELEIKTRKRSELVEISEQVREAVREEGFREGLVHLYVPHTTAALTVSEHIDPRVGADLLSHLDRLVPWSGAWSHQGNAAAHVKASLVGHSLVLAVEDGAPAVGSWQGIFFCEFDGPRKRKVWLSFTGA